MYFSCRIPKHITLNDVIMVTGVIGGTNHKNYWDTGYFGLKLMGYTGYSDPPKIMDAANK